MDYAIYVVTRASIFVIAAVGLNILAGYAGQISLGHAAFLAIGAYTHTILYRLGAPLILSMPLGSALAGILGALIGFPALRLKGPHLAIATLGFQVAIEQVLARWNGLTGGRMGLQVPAPAILVRIPPLAYLAMAASAAVVVVTLARNLTRSRVGRAWVAIRENETAAEAMGIDIAAYKSMAFVISAATTGLAGAMLVHLGGSINPSNFALLDSIELIVMIMVGGMGSIAGSVMGAVLVVTLTHAFSAFREFQTMAIGCILLAVILFEPRGMYGRWLRLRPWVESLSTRAPG